MFGLRYSGFTLLASVFLAGCTSDGDISNIFWRKLTWGSYLSGEDLQNSCEEGQDRFRLIYNADRATQVVSFNWQSGDNNLIVDDLTRKVKLSDAGGDLFDIWNQFNVVQHQFQLDDLRHAALGERGFNDQFLPALEVDGRLNSSEYFVSLSSCFDGEFKLTVFGQDQLVDEIPATLSLVTGLLADQLSLPAFPEEKTQATAKDYIDASDASSFVHYELLYTGEKLILGRQYRMK